MEELVKELEKVNEKINVSPAKELYEKRAIIYNRLEKFDLAMKDYENIIQLDSNDYMAYYERACEWYNWKIYYLDEHPEEEEVKSNTIGYLEKSVNLKETSKAYYRMAEIYFNLLDDNEEALIYCNKALAIEEDESWRIEELKLQGQIYNEIGYYDEAIETLTNVLDKVKDEDAFLFRGIVYSNLADDEEDGDESRALYINSLKDFQNAALLDEENIFSCMKMAEILKDVFDEVESTAECYTKVLMLEPSNEEANEYLAGYFYDRGEYRKSVECIDNIGELDLDLYYLNKYKAECYYELGEYAKALNIYNRVLEKTDDKSIYDYRGDVYLKLGECDKAILDYKKFIEYYPESKGVYYRLGQAYIEKGDYENALKVLKKALQLLPGNKQILDLINKINN